MPVFPATAFEAACNYALVPAVLQKQKAA